MKKMNITIVVMLIAFLTSTSAHANNQRLYEVTITNVTKAIQFTPILVATHSSDFKIFEVGKPAIPELALLAEDGNPGPLAEVALASGKVAGSANSADVLGTPPLLFPGQTVTLQVTSNRRARFLSLAAMLLPTNDSFVALNTVRLPIWGSRTYQALGYDAGSETNDEICANIPGPVCGGAGSSPDDAGEGYVFISNGIHGIGDLSPATYDWRNPVAIVKVTRLYNY